MKRLALTCCLLVMVMTMGAQRYMHYHMNDGTFNGFYTDCIDSILHSVDLTQVYADGQVYKIPLANVDSVTFEGVNLAIDLGLPSGTKWACCNVGASSPEDYGGYYAWGETEEKSYYDWDTYKYYNDNTGCINIGSNISGTQYDVAHVKWGGSWRMPTEDEIEELVNNCSWKWTTYNGVNGKLVTGPNGNSIFLPAAGYRLGTELYSRGSHGDYWSATLNEYGSYNARYFDFYYGGCWFYDSGRYCGHTVRPVTD